MRYLASWPYTSGSTVPSSKVFTLVTRPDGAMLRAGQLNKEEQ